MAVISRASPEAGLESTVTTPLPWEQRVYSEVHERERRSIAGVMLCALSWITVLVLALVCLKAPGIGNALPGHSLRVGAGPENLGSRSLPIVGF